MKEYPSSAANLSGDRPLGIVAAFQWEVRPLLRLAARPEIGTGQANCCHSKVKRLDSKLYSLDLNSGPVLLTISGAGSGHSFRAAQFLAENYQLRGLVSMGFAGGLIPDLTPGDVIQGERVVVGSSGEQFECQADLLPVRFHQKGGLLSMDGVVNASDQKLHLGKKWGAVAVDMESAGVARAAALAGLPFCAIKSITDPAEQSLSIDFNLCQREDNWLSLWAIAWQGMKSTRAVGDLWRLAQGARRAADALGSVIASVNAASHGRGYNQDVRVSECG